MATKKASKTVKKTASVETLENSLLGSAIKNFKLPSTSGDFKLSDFKGQNVVLYFYPKDNTPGCTQEGHDFSALKKQFEKLNTVVFGISRDTLKSHSGFKEKQSYTVDLISDEKEEACSIFNVMKMKNMYGKKVRGIERSTFLIGPNGKVLKEWRKVSVDGHANEVLDAVKTLSE